MRGPPRAAAATRAHRRGHCASQLSFPGCPGALGGAV